MRHAVHLDEVVGAVDEGDDPVTFAFPGEIDLEAAQALDLDVEPCTRYWFEAKKPSALSQDFEPRVNYQEPIAGCGEAARR